ncbi:MAG: hypothetical protein BGN96_11185 [Bacteroidales bacterium 45-6]|nr:MAG: hypothetical protein BGN96_11185 [Bacteroidales bacterium 45-6]
MVNFKTIELGDKKAIDACLANNSYQSCDFCFANLFAWNCKFQTVFAIVNDTLFLQFRESDGQLYYMMPIGKMPLRKAFELLIEDASKKYIPFRMKGVSSVMWKQIEQEMPGMFHFIHDRNNDEYIYLTEKLINLSGKKLQSKRNHINRFKAENPDWTFSPITERAEVDECIRMLCEWEDLNAERADKTLRYDYIATKTMLDNFDALRLCGGYVRTNGKIVAFSIGEPVNEDTFVVHVEKAYSGVNGAYTIINQQFAEHCGADYKYINREEDMGFENLRKAKLSYYPDILLEEGTVILV